ncbi:unnamed protein product [Adineta ricciae]|uniref:Uncharacterized protein n=1 Tax=Adineta ricciae TaxID=249248 RepID=A0A814XLE4_ADIRI|nr:unnamed protein product [Adineta ricciae]CAF1338908.1 unnamed protein product [Adineta ricciae]
MSSNRLSTFGERLQSLSDSFYSTILQDSKQESKFQVKNAQQLENLTKTHSSEQNHDDFTFDQCSISHLTSNDDFSFTFHSIEQSKLQGNKSRQKHQISRIKHTSTPYSTHEDRSIKKSEDETVVVEETHRPPSLSSPSSQPIIIGYYPVVTYQPVCVPPAIYLSKEQIQSQINDYSTLTKITPLKKR